MELASLRIFTAIRHSKDPAYFDAGLWTSNFYPALYELDCEIVESQTDLLPTSRFMAIPDDFTPQELEMRAKTTQLILDEVQDARRRGPVHLFLSYFYNSHFDPAGFDELRQMGIPSINFYCNSIYQFENVAAIAASADFSWHPERDARARYLAAGATPVRVQMGADPKKYYPAYQVGRESKVCFVGQRYSDRDRWLATLVKADVPIAIYGQGWRTDYESQPHRRNEVSYLGRKQLVPGTVSSYMHVMSEIARSAGIVGGLCRSAALFRHRLETRKFRHLLSAHARGRAGDLSATFANYEVCLNLSNVWVDGRAGSQLLSHVRLRDFEGPMCRACYLTGSSDEIAEFYKIGIEIETYGSEGELVDKARFYLTHPSASERLREAGWQRAIRDHTWKQRFKKLFREIGLET
jgi:spore maturation protein CgeB